MNFVCLNPTSLRNFSTLLLSSVSWHVVGTGMAFATMLIGLNQVPCAIAIFLSELFFSNFL